MSRESIAGEVRWIHACPKARSGSALLVVLVSSAIIGIGLASYLSLISQQHKIVMRSQAWNSAMPLLEAGIEEALTQINVNVNDLSRDGWHHSENGSYTRWRWMDPGIYVVQISNVMPPVIFASGYVRAPRSQTYLPPRTVVVQTKRDAMFSRGMVAKGTIEMNGNNVRTDSFDSDDPNFSTSGRYDSNRAKDNGDVATNSGLVNSLSVGNANLFGHAATGPGGSISVGASGAVGSSAWHLGGSSGVQPGWSADDMNVSFPDVVPPFNSGTTPASGSVGGTNYTLVMGTGSYLLNQLSLSGLNKVLVTGHAVLYVTGSVSLEGNAFIAIATNNASLKLFVGGPSASLGGEGVANGAGSATNFFFYGLPSLTSLSYSGNAVFVGAVYAPNAAFSLSGGGNNTLDFVGASVTGSVRMNGHFNFHYDENLGRVGPSRGFIVTSWNELVE